MGWIETRIKERQEADQRFLSESLLDATRATIGQGSTENEIDYRAAAGNAIERIMKYYRLEAIDMPESISDIYDQLNYCLRPHGVMYREVKLDKDWYKNSIGPILTRTIESGVPIALIPGKISGYWFVSPETGLPVKVNALTAMWFDENALCFYRPLPQKKLDMQDLLLYLGECIALGDVVIRGLAVLGVALVGILIPRLVGILTGPVLASGEVRALVGIALCIVCVSVSQQLISNTAALLSSRLESKVRLGVESSLMMRLLSLPSRFFEQYSPGELESRFMAAGPLCTQLLSVTATTGLTSIASLIYLTQIFAFAPSLVIPAVIVVLVTVVFSVVTALVSVKANERRMDASATESGMSYTIISGIRKIRLAGAEKEMFSKWLDSYAKVADLTYNPPLLIKVSSVITLGIALVANIVLYYLAVKSGVDQSSYFAFTTAYGMMMGAFASFSNALMKAASVRPMLRMIEPFLQAVPETSGGKKVTTGIIGNVEFDHVSFRYSPDAPLVLKDLSFNVHAGEYVAIVGKSGCGKSTLVRLLLGFEKPDEGCVFVDGNDLAEVDLPSLRRNIGTVMQRDGLFQGSIYYNIAITSPDLTVEEAWEAAEIAGIADDIRALPMGMHTFMSEGHGSISGGQKQRLMIARAIAPKPKLLIFDEATSALDNKTQKQVSEALDKMGCTRIIIAHRLSTIRHCDRILVLDGGQIVEDGTYDELLAKGGLFAKLVERQRADL